jgi:Yip1 domain
MKNVVVCKNCNSENPFYGLICVNCKSYLRERVYNIDLWHTISVIIESPSKAFRLIINSEHKNFLLPVLLLVSGKILLNGIFLKIYLLKEESEFPNYFGDYLLSLLLLIAIILLFSALLKIITGKSGIQTRYFDNFSIFSYSFLPYIFGIIILFPIELILFGGYLFSYNPTPFQIKETLSYVLFIFEALLILWSIFLTIFAIKVVSESFAYSFIFGILIHAVFYISLGFLSIYLFK